MSNSKPDKNIAKTKARVIFMVGEVGEDMVKEVLQSMQQLEAKSHDDIVVYLSSVGGDVNSGLAIFDAFYTSPCKIIGVVYGESQSMAAVILQACHTRLLAPNATYMLHDGSTGMSRTHTKEFIETAKYFEKQCLQIDTLVSNRTGISIARIQELSKFSTSLNSNDAVQMGFADGILIRAPKVTVYKPKKRSKK